MIEHGATVDIFERPREAHTRELLEAVPRLGAFSGTNGPPRVTSAPLRAPPPEPVLLVNDLTVTYGVGAGWLGRRQSAAPTVKGVSFENRRRPHSGSGWRERLGQVDDWQGRAWPCSFCRAGGD